MTPIEFLQMLWLTILSVGGVFTGVAKMSLCFLERVCDAIEG